MSLPLLLSYRGNGSGNGPGSKLRGGAGKPGRKKGRSSIDTGSASTGQKRSVSALGDAPTETLIRDAFGLFLEDSGAQSPSLSKVGILGSHLGLGESLADCLASKPGVCHVGVHTSTHQLGKFDVMPGIQAHRTLRELCQWSSVFFVCSSYKETQAVLRSKDLRVHLKGKCVVNLARGTPEDAIETASVARDAGVRYLDAYVITGGAKAVFGHRLSSMMVSGSPADWQEVESVVKAVAPASFYGGPAVAWANSVTIGVSNFFSSLQTVIQDAEAYTSKFQLPRHVLPQVIANGFMGKVRAAVLAPPQRSLCPPRLPVSAPVLVSPTACITPCKGVSVSNGATTSTSTKAVSCPDMHPRSSAAPAAGSDEWREQLLQIRELCRGANVQHSVIDSLLAGVRGLDCPATTDKTNEAVGCGLSLTEDDARNENDGRWLQAGNGDVECESDLGGVFDEDLSNADFCAMSELLSEAPLMDDTVLTAAWVP